MGLKAKVFGLDDKEAYMRTNQAKAMLLQEVKQYQAAEQRCKEQVPEVLKRGDKSLANQLAGNVSKYRAKIHSLQEEISDIEAVNMQAFSNMSEKQRLIADMPSIVRYGNKQADTLTALKEPYAAKLREASNRLARSQETNAAALSGVISEAYVPDTAKTVLDEIMAEIETSKQQNAADKGAVKAAAAAAAGA